MYLAKDLMSYRISVHVGYSSKQSPSHAKAKQLRAKTATASPVIVGSARTELSLVFSPRIVTFSPFCRKHVLKSVKTVSSFAYISGTSHHR